MGCQTVTKITKLNEIIRAPLLIHTTVLEYMNMVN